MYETNAILSTEISVEIDHILAYDPKDNDITHMTELDMIEENYVWAFYQIERYWGRVKHAYNRQVFPHSFWIGDLVLQKVQLGNNLGKLSPR